MPLVKKTVDQWLNDIDYDDDPAYVPSEFALEFISFIKLVNLFISSINLSNK